MTIYVCIREYLQFYFLSRNRSYNNSLFLFSSSTIRDVSCPVVSRICYIKFLDTSSVAVAQHMSNTVFIDRAVVVVPVPNGQIPDEFKAIEMLNNGTLIPGQQPCTGFKLPPECINRIEGSAPNQVITTSDPKLEQNDLPKYPNLPVNFDARRIEETRRTILVLDTKPDWTVEDLIDFFEAVGEVKYGRVAEKDTARHIMIEFSEQKSVVDALKLQGAMFNGEPLNLYHSTEPITKPQAKTNEAAQKEIEDAMSIVKEAQSMISAAIDPMIGSMLTKEKAPASSAATSRRRSRSRSREPRRRRDRSRNRGSRRSRSRSPRRSRSRSRRRSRSRSRSKRSTSRRRRSRSRDRDRRRKSKSRQRSRSRSRDRRRDKRRDRTDKRTKKSPARYRSKSRERDRDKDRERKSKRRSPDYPKKVRRDYDDEEKIGQEGSMPREIKKRAARTPSPAKSDHMDLSSP